MYLERAQSPKNRRGERSRALRALNLQSYSSFALMRRRAVCRGSLFFLTRDDNNDNGVGTLMGDFFIASGIFSASRVTDFSL